MSDISLAWQHTLYVLIIMTSAMITGALAVYIWRRRAFAPNAFPLSILLFLITFWSLAYDLRILSHRLICIGFWKNLVYTVAACVPVSWLAFALEYAQSKYKLSIKLLTVLLIIPFITVVIIWTNPVHNLFWEIENYFWDGPFLVSNRPNGPWFKVHLVYSYILVIVGIILIIRSAIRSFSLQRQQTTILVMTATVPVLLNVMGSLDRLPYWLPNLDYTPLGFAFSGLGLAWNASRHQLFDVVPIARETLIESMGDMVFVVDPGGNLLYCNPAAQSSLDLTLSDLIGHSIVEFIPNLDGLFGMWNIDNVPKSLSITCPINSEPRNYNLQISPLRDRQQACTGYLFVLHDVTELLMAKQQAQAADRAKSEFISNISHELRTPLTSIKIYHQLFDRVPQSKQQEYLRSLRRETERLQYLIESILQFSRLDLGKVQFDFTQLDINDLLSDLVTDRETLFTGQGLHLQLQVTPDLPPIQGDSQRLGQVFTNLLTNALNYTSPGGFVFVETGCEEWDNSKWVTVVVQDTGMGISQDEQQIIFERFKRGNASQYLNVPGTGLGLAISKQIIELHQGRITLESQVGEGSKFTVWLPAVNGYNEELFCN
ncbi:MAG: PAS domain-containing protein [Anaerolineae bacterium]|nr:PAS domain-containing protein [Anaerolineae bacterium]